MKSSMYKIKEESESPSPSPSPTIDHNHLIEQALMSSSFDVASTNINMANQDAVLRIEQQLQIQKKLRYLQKDVNRVSRLGKSKIDSLSNLEARVMLLKDKIRDNLSKSVEDEVKDSLNDIRLTDNAKVLKSNEVANAKLLKFQICNRCGRKIIVSLFKTHENSCLHINNDNDDNSYKYKDKSKFVGKDVDSKTLALQEHALFTPKAPRNVKMQSFGSDYLEFAWLPPLSDGGSPVFDYELSYLEAYYVINPVTKIPKLKSSTIVIRTSNWCLREPVFHRGYKLNQHVRAGTMYSHLKVRCWNLVGSSEWVNILDSYEDVVNTEPAKPPSQPLLVTVTKITASCCHVRWNSPYFTGGLPIAKYHIEYVYLEKQTSADKTVYVEQTFSIFEPAITVPLVSSETSTVDTISTTDAGTAASNSSKQTTSAACTCVIRNIPADTEILRITVHALNEGDLRSPAARLLTQGLRTSKGSRYDQLRRQLLHAKSLTTKFIDTDFSTGVHQRVLRQDFIAKVGEQLQREQPSEEEAQEAEMWNMIIVNDIAKKRKQHQHDDHHDDFKLSSDSDSEEYSDDDDNNDDDEDGHGIKTSRSTNSKISATNTKMSQRKKKKKKSFEFTTNQRRQHFQMRINYFEYKLKKLTAQRNRIDIRKIELSEFMKSCQSKTYMLKLEKDRFANYKEDIVTSSVVHGYEVRYQFHEFLQAVNKEIDKSNLNLKNAKLDLLTDERRRLELLSLIAIKEVQLHDRKLKYKLFETKINSVTSTLDKLRGGLGLSNESLKRSHYDLWKDFVQRRKYIRDMMTKVFHFHHHVYTYQAFFKWMHGIYPHEHADPSTAVTSSVKQRKESVFECRDGLGTHLLQLSETHRKELQSQIRDIITTTSVVNHDLKRSKLSYDIRTKLSSSDNSNYYQLQEESFNVMKMINIGGMKYLYQGDAYTQQGMYERARDLYESQIIYLSSQQYGIAEGADTVSGSRLSRLGLNGNTTGASSAASKSGKSDDIKTKKAAASKIQNQNILRLKYLAMCYGRLGRMFMLQGRFDCAIVEFDRQLAISREGNDEAEAADAYFGLGYGYMKMFEYEDSIRYLDIAQSKYKMIQNNDKLCTTLIALRDSYERLGRIETSKFYHQKIESLQTATTTKFRFMENQLVEYNRRLVGTAASSELIVKLERLTPKAVELKESIEQTNNKLEEIEMKLEDQMELCATIEFLLTAIDREMKVAEESDELEMWSSLVHDQAQLIEIEELKIRLKTRKEIEINRLKMEKKLVDQLNMQIDNLEQTIAEDEEVILIEKGPLMSTSHKHVFRSIAFAKVNIKSDEVTGTHTGGVENFVAVETNRIDLFNYLTGEVLHMFMGGKDVHGQIAGHTGVVTCVTLDKQFIYSGSMDELIIVWDMNTRKLARILKGHEGSIVAVAVSGHYLVSSSSDLTMRIWDKLTGQQMRVVTGHMKSVLTLEIDDTWFVSGSADGEIRVWDIIQKTAKSISVECKLRLQDYEYDSPITCLQRGSLEVVSGDSQGNLAIWWLESGELLKRCVGVHKGKITCLQFDAVHIVSGGVDMKVCIVDICTGDIIQTLRGHENMILAVAFDSVRILTASADNTLRYWKWGSRSSSIEDKIHILESHETLLHVSKLYNITLDELMHWNGIIDSRRQVYPGLALIVKKGDPNSLTKAEKAVLERQRRLNMGKKVENTSSNINTSRNDDHFDTSRSTASASGPAEAAIKNKEVSATESLMSKDSFEEAVKKANADMKNEPVTLGNRMFKKYKDANELFPSSFDPEETRRGGDSSLTSRLLAKDGKKKQIRTAGDFLDDGAALERRRDYDGDGDDDSLENLLNTSNSNQSQYRYQISVANMDRWGPVSDELSAAMLNIYIERAVQSMIHDIIYKESVNIGKLSVGGRMKQNRLIQLKAEAEAEERQRKLIMESQQQQQQQVQIPTHEMESKLVLPKIDE